MPSQDKSLEEDLISFPKRPQLGRRVIRVNGEDIDLDDLEKYKGCDNIPNSVVEAILSDLASQIPESYVVVAEPKVVRVYGIHGQ